MDRRDARRDDDDDDDDGRATTMRRGRATGDAGANADGDGARWTANGRGREGNGTARSDTDEGSASENASEVSARWRLGRMSSREKSVGAGRGRGLTSFEAMVAEANACSARNLRTGGAGTNSVFGSSSETSKSSKSSKSSRREVSAKRTEKREAKLRVRHQKKQSNRYKKSLLVLSPQKPILQKWEAVMMALLCYTAIVTPMEVGFYTPSFNALFYINQVVTACFITDLVLNFFVATPHHRTGHLIYNQAYVAQSYLKKWFIIDFLSAIPFDALYLGVGSSALAQLSILRTLRLLRLVKLVRILRVNRIYKRLELVYTIDYSLLELMKFGLTAIMFAHWLACGFGLVEDLEGTKYSWTRSTEFGDLVIGPDGGEPREVVGSLRLFLAALYWSTMTISTIGYGDIVPVTTGERVYVIVAMLVGAFEYGYIVGAVSNVIATRNEKVNKFQGVMRDLNGFLTDHGFPQDLRVRLREYFKYQLDGADADVYRRLLEKMSPALRSECTMRMNTWIRNVDFFKYCPEPLVIHLSTRVVEHTYPPEEALFRPGDAVSTIFLIRRGVVQVDGLVKMSGKTIAEEALYSSDRLLYGAQSLTYADIYTLEREDFHAALGPYPATRKFFRLKGIKMIFRGEIIAYSKAYYALKAHGVDADLSGEVSERPAFYLQKLRIIYGDDGEGLDDPKILEQKTKAAVVIQKRFRGMLHRVSLHRLLVERGVQGIFHKVLRERDPMSYTARALDVFHWRLAYSLTEMHRKLNSLLDHGNIEDVITSESSGTPSLMATALQAATGKAMTAPRKGAKKASTDGAPPQTPVTSARAITAATAGWDTTSTENPLQRLQTRVDELTNRLVPLDRKITSSQAKQTAALAETNERLSEVTAQLETLLNLTVSNMETGLAEARSVARASRPRRQSLSPPPRSEALSR